MKICYRKRNFAKATKKVWKYCLFLVFIFGCFLYKLNNFLRFFTRNWVNLWSEFVLQHFVSFIFVVASVPSTCRYKQRIKNKTIEFETYFFLGQLESWKCTFLVLFTLWCFVLFVYFFRGIFRWILCKFIGAILQKQWTELQFYTGSNGA